MYCTNCGKEIGNYKYCHFCGEENHFLEQGLQIESEKNKEKSVKETTESIVVPDNQKGEQQQNEKVISVAGWQDDEPKKSKPSESTLKTDKAVNEQTIIAKEEPKNPTLDNKSSLKDAIKNSSEKKNSVFK